MPTVRSLPHLSERERDRERERLRERASQKEREKVVATLPLLAVSLLLAGCEIMRRTRILEKITTCQKQETAQITP